MSFNDNFEPYSETNDAVQITWHRCVFRLPLYFALTDLTIILIRKDMMNIIENSKFAWCCRQFLFSSFVAACSGNDDTVTSEITIPRTF